MSFDSPTKTLFNSDGYEAIVKDGDALSEQSSALLIAGSDGTDSHYISLDSLGHKIIVGTGSAESPDGGVVSVQGTAGIGDETKIIGNVSIDNFPADLSAVQDDASQLLANVGGLGVSGSVAVGNPVRIGGSDAVSTADIKTDTLGRINISGAVDAGGSIAGSPVILGVKSGGLMINIKSDSNGNLIRVGSVDAGLAVAGAPARLGGSDGALTTDIKTDSAGRLISAGAVNDDDLLDGTPVRLGASDGSATRNILSDSAGRIINVGAAADGSAPSGNPILSAGWDGTNVQIFKLDSTGAVQVNEIKPNYAVTTTVAGNTSSTLLLDSNVDREGALVYNDSNRTMYIKFGSAVSKSDFTTKIPMHGHYEIPSDYTGSLYGLWDEGVTGNVKLTELTYTVNVNCLSVNINGETLDPGAETSFEFVGDPAGITLSGSGDYNLYSGGPSDPSVWMSSGSVTTSVTIVPDLISESGSYHITIAEPGCSTYTFYFTIA